MDYSTADEHPESSPWASSPQHNRTSFETPASPPFARSEPPDEHPAHEQPFASETQPSLPIASTENGESIEHPSAPDPATQDGPQTAPPATEQRQAQPKKARPDKPNYKLQAKITGLERNGRKDPILKFDVYVWPLSETWKRPPANVLNCRPIFPDSAPLSIAMSAGLTANSSSLQSI